MENDQDDGLHADREPAQQVTSDKAGNSKATLIRSFGVVISLVVVIVCSFLLYNLFKDSVDLPTLNDAEQQAVSEPATVGPEITQLRDTETAQAVESETTATAEPPPPPLPNLNNSDEEIQQAATQLTPALKWADWITTEEAIRKFVVVIDNMSQGKIARKYLPIPKPEKKFVNSSDGIKVYLDPAGFERYTPYISLFESIDNDMAVELYQRYSPLMEQAFAELGYPDQNFHDTLMQAFDLLLSAPVIEEKIELVRPSVLYKFAYPTLENAPAVHKQLIRMGPENTRRLKDKIQQLKAGLRGIKPSS